MELFSLKPNKLLIFHVKTCKALEKQTKKSAWKKTLVFCDIFLIFTVVNHEEILSGNS